MSRLFCLQKSSTSEDPPSSPTTDSPLITDKKQVSKQLLMQNSDLRLHLSCSSYL